MTDRRRSWALGWILGAGVVLAIALIGPFRTPPVGPDPRIGPALPDGGRGVGVGLDADGRERWVAGRDQPGSQAVEPVDPGPVDLLLRTVWADTDVPAPGVEVQVQEIGAPGTPWRTFSRWSDRTGEVQVSDLSRQARYRFQARRGPWEDLPPAPEAGSWSHLIRVVAVGPLLVRVLAPDGRPHAGARVLAISEDPALGGSDTQRELGTTGEDGTLRLDDILGLGTLTAQAESFALAAIQEIGAHRLRLAERGERLPPLELRLGPGGGRLTVSVRDAAAQPVPAAKVVLMRQEAGWSPLESRVALPNALTDPSGVLHLAALEPGQYHVGVLHGRSGSWSGYATVLPASTSELELRLIPHAEIEFRPHVGGVGLSDVAVRVRGPFGLLRGTTGAEGTARVEGVPVGQVFLTASHAEAGRADGEVELGAGKRHLWEPELEQRATLAGVVLDLRSEPRVAWQVLAFPARAPIGESGVREAMTDADGRFRFTGLARVPQRLEVRRDPIQVLPNGELAQVRPSRVDLVIHVPDEPVSASLRGQVAVPDGLGFEALVVDRVGAAGGVTCALDAEGLFESGPLAPGSYTLLMGTRSGRYPLGIELELGPGDQRDLGRLPVPIPATLEVMLADPADPRAVEVTLQSLAGADFQILFDARLSGTGRLEQGGVPPGAYWLSAQQGWTRLHGSRVELVGGVRTQVRIELAAHPPVSWAIEVRESAQVQYVLRLRDPEGVVRLAQSYPASPGSFFRLDAALPPGPYVCEVWGDGVLLEELAAEVPFDPRSDAPLATWVLGD